MRKTKLTIILVLLFFTTGCCNVFKHSKGIEIPPYVIEYYHYDNPDEPTPEEKQSEGCYEHIWDNGFKMDFKIARIEGSGVFFYKLVYRADNLTEKKVKLFDQNFELVDIDTGITIERIRCWNWQRKNMSVPCNVAEIGPKRAITKEIRFDYSTDEKFASGISVRMGGLSFEKGETTIDFYAKPKH